MKLKKIIVVAIAATGLVTNSARAVHIWQDPCAWTASAFSYCTNPKYNSWELTLDLAGSYLVNQTHFTEMFDHSIRSGRWGGNVGENLFFTPWLGIGADANFADNRGIGGPAAGYVMGNVFLRLPIANTGLAPYIFGGGGRLFSPHWEWGQDLGIGLEFRISPVIGFFVDDRYIWHNQSGSTDRMLFRGGLRLAF